MTCTATINVAPTDWKIGSGYRSVPCTLHVPSPHGNVPSSFFPHGNEEEGLRWNDDCAGAFPHRDPEPTYRAIASPHAGAAGNWVVQVNDGSGWWRYAATFQGEFHPDPQGAAEAEAARLKGDGPTWKATLDAALALAIEQRDEAKADAEEHHVRANDNFDEAMRWRATAERFRDALEKIAREGASGQLQPAIFARDVLGGRS